VLQKESTAPLESGSVCKGFAVSLTVSTEPLSPGCAGSIEHPAQSQPIRTAPSTRRPSGDAAVSCHFSIMLSSSGRFA
jgi:hypothetical protein